MKDFWQAFAVGSVVALISLAIFAHAQKAERGTQQWNIAIDNFHTVRVIDTAGVCLYVYMGAHGGLAVVPKTQLPAGTGCQ